MRTKIRFVLLATPVLMLGALAGAAPAGAATATRAGACNLPPLTGTPLLVVRRILPLVGCRLGTITRQISIFIDKDAVIKTSPGAGRYPRNAAVGVVISGGAAAGLRSSQQSGAGTNEDPYTGSCETVDGVCRVTFDNRHLQIIFDHEYVPAYRCPGSDPWLLKKSVTQGRIVPPGVLFEAHYGRLGVNITGVSKKEGKTERRANKVYSFEYATGTLTGFPNSSVTNLGFGGAIYGISIFCTNDLTKANLVNVRG